MILQKWISLTTVLTSLLTFLLFGPFASAQGTTFRVLGASGKVLLEQNLPRPTGFVGAVSDQVLSQALTDHRLQQYRGSESGVLSVEGLSSANEVLSDTQMNAYGWCYRVDGRLSDLNADQHQLSGSEILVEWFYAYAHLEKNDWTSMCVPADHVPVQE